MRGVRIPHDLNGEDQFVLGLSVTRLAAVLFGLLAAYTILHLGIPLPLRMLGALLTAGAGAAIAWVRPEGRSLVHWALAAFEFNFARDIQRVNSPRVLSRVPQLSIVSTLAPSPRTTTGSPAAQLEDDLVVESDVIDLPAAAVVEMLAPSEGLEARAATPVPVYLGGPQVITFFSAKGGTGRTTLATEVATLLAHRGRYKGSASCNAAGLKVVLVDFDLGSANVSARLGLAQPTLLDYVGDLTTPAPDPCDFLVRHAPSGLDVLLGPSKCLSGDRSDLVGIPQAAHILSSLKAAGYHFIVVDISASVGNLETYLLEAASQIFCVVTPTAGSVQSLYRGVETLRRLGHGGKLHYVANKMRDGLNLAEPMGDLGGVLVARIPYDTAFDTAENRHQPLAIHGSGPSQHAIGQLAAAIYPAIEVATHRSAVTGPFGWLGWRRHAG